MTTTYDFTEAARASFELGDRLVNSQRQLATNLFTAGIEFAESARKAAEAAAEATVAAVRDAAREQEGALRTAAERAAGKAA
jgi:hypothetical protein